MVDAPLTVDHEHLIFEISEHSSSEARITADYTLSNTAQESLIIPMVFPTIAENRHAFFPPISLNGNPVDYEVFFAGGVSVKDYFSQPEVFAGQADINAIIAALNELPYEPVNFTDTAQATLYEVTLGTEMDRQSKMSFGFNPTTTKVLSADHQGMAGTNKGQTLEVEFSRYVGPNSIGKTMSVLVLGEDSLDQLTISPSDTLVKREVTIRDYLRERLVQDEEQWLEHAKRNTDNFYSTLLQQLDHAFSDTTMPVVGLDDLMTSTFHHNNISVFLFSVELQPNSTSSLTVSYPVRATIDRRASSDYVHTYAYLLNPARNFSRFGSLDLEVRLNALAPHIIESSLPLQETEMGRYIATFESLPEVDLVFSTYARPEITSLERTAAKVLPSGYMRALVVMLAGGLLAAAALIISVKRILSLRMRK